jgi:alpha-1,3-mannosyl-glycoprotein beta-1,2-N-acetylglucosaminyltransferase
MPVNATKPRITRTTHYCFGVMQDDMQIAVDFFSYFEAGAKLLDDDPKLYSVSSWNDHGQARHVNDPFRLERSDFFPGLGWMLTNAVWQSLQ